VAGRLSIPKSSAVGLLGTLVTRGYVVRQGLLYELAPRFVQGGWVGGQVSQLIRVSHSIMAAAVEETGESAFLGIMTPDWRIQYIDKVVSPKEVRYDGSLAHYRPAYCTSIGHCFLAEQSEAALSRYLRSTPLVRVAKGTLTSPTALRAALAKVRKQGFAESIDGHVDGASGVAAPIRGPNKQVIAGVTIAAPSSRFASAYDKLVAACMGASGEITRILGAMNVLEGTAGPPVLPDDEFSKARRPPTGPKKRPKVN
jgi:DNA-binding IclR family transcriptional regulator